MGLIIGVHCNNVDGNHDPNIGIVGAASDHLAAHEAERITRKKYGGRELFFGDFTRPAEHFAEYLHSVGISLDEIDAFAYLLDDNPYRWNIPHFLDLLQTILHVEDRPLLHEFMREALLGRTPLVGNGLCGKPTYLVKHHTAHAAYTWYTSPFDEAFVFAYDGGGFEIMTQISHGRGRELIGFENLPHHCFGFLYATMTQHVIPYLTGGKPSYGSEGKVMALAGHGQPIFQSAIESFLRCRHALGGWDVSEQSILVYTDPALLDPHAASYEGERRFRFAADYAASWQAFFETVTTDVLLALRDTYGFQNLCIGGGCGLNGLVNARLRATFGSVWVPPATSDCGIGLGAALYVAHDRLGKPKMSYGNVACVGRSYDNDAESVRSLARDFVLREYVGDELFRAVAEELAEGRIVGWYQGRSECGPRALGNRSILCDPRRAEMKDIINHRVKHREPYRPFAPAILREHLHRYFDAVADDPYMLTIARSTERAKAEIPATLHIDGTARVQSVRTEDNPRFHQLISAFHDLTGVPALLNTSFNDNGEPLVESVTDALDAFARMHIDTLVIGNMVIRKSINVSSQPPIIRSTLASSISTTR